MSQAVLIDTSAILGLYLPGDEWHAPARETLSALQRRGRPLFATSDILGEVVTLMRRWGGHANAVKAGELLLASRVIRLVPIDEPAREDAWRLFKGNRTPELTLTDCTSAAVMSRLGIEEVFTFDSDFQPLGFRILPGPA